MWPSTTDGRPAFGRHERYVRACCERWRRCSVISAGPVAQFMPITSGRIASSAVSAAPISEPTSMRPVVSTVTCSMIGTVRPSAAMALRHAIDRGLALEEVHHRLDEDDVDATGDQAVGLLLVGVAQGDEVDVAERRKLGAGPDRPDHVAGPVGRGVAVGDLAGDLRGPQVDLVGLLRRSGTRSAPARTRRRSRSRPRRRPHRRTASASPRSRRGG